MKWTLGVKYQITKPKNNTCKRKGGKNIVAFWTEAKLKAAAVVKEISYGECITPPVKR